MARRDLTPTQSQVDQKDPTGWLSAASITLSYSSATRTLTVSPTSGTYTYYTGGRRIVGNTTWNVQHSATTGLHFFYFDHVTDNLVTSTTPWVIGGYDVPVSLIYYNATTGEGIYYDERHGMQMDGETHHYLHFTQGTKVISGFAASGYTLNPATPTNASNDLAVASGVIADEDLDLTVPSMTGAAGTYRIWYRTGVSGEWTWDSSDLPYTTGTTYAQYNQLTGGAWQKTSLTSNQWVNMWVCATPALTPNHGIIVIMGQTTFASLATATAEAFNSLSFGTLPFEEVAALYRVTLRASSNAAYNGVTGRVRIESLTRIVGSTVTVNQTAVADHSALSGLSAPNAHPATAISTDVVNFGGILDNSDTTVQLALDKIDDHTHAQYALDSGVVHVVGTETITGLKTFQTESSTDIGLIIKGSAAQSASLQEWHDSSGNIIAKIDSQGRFTSPNVDIGYVEDTSKASSISVTTPVLIDSFSSTLYRSGEYLIQFTQGTNYTTTKILIVHNGIDIAISEYATVSIGDPIDYVFDSSFSLGNLETTVTCSTANVTPVTIKFTRTIFDV